MLESTLIKENRERLSKFSQEYDPILGIGSLTERYRWGIFLLPKSMGEDEEWLLLLEIKEQIPEEEFFKAMAKIRIKHDFEFWAATAIKIKDKKTGVLVFFYLNEPQRGFVRKLEKDRNDKKPIRIVLLKGRQWGGSTVTQLYALWLQNIHHTYWNSVIVGDVEEQARNIRSMYTVAANNYPVEYGSITLVPFEGSAKNKIVAESNSLISIGSMQKPESLRSADIKIGHLCIHPQVEIPTFNGFVKKAEDINIGDRVITHTGAIASVSAVTKSKPNIYNGNGESIKIRCWLSREIELTPNHPVYTDKGWVNAGELTKEHKVKIPIRGITKDYHEIMLDKTPARKQGGGKKSKFDNAIIKISKEFGYFIGYYLAEGSIAYNVKNGKKNPNSITLSRHDNDSHFSKPAIEAVRKYITSVRTDNRKGCLTTSETLYGSNLSRYIVNEVGVKNKKQIPDHFFQYGEDFLEGLLKGYLSGDGSKTNDLSNNKYESATMSVSSISSSLVFQIRDIAASLGYGWGAIDFKKGGILYGRNCQDIYILRWHGEAARKLKSLIGIYSPNSGHKPGEKYIIKDNYVHLKIRSIQKSTIDTVIDIEVDHQDHSFRTAYFPVKNSEVAFWKKTAGKDPEDLTQSLIGTVPMLPDTMIVMETTAKGVGNFFHQIYTSSKAGKSGYDTYFVSWFEFKDNQLPLKESEYQNFFDSLDEYEKFLWNSGATLEGIKWYRFKLAEMDGNTWRMCSEFPSNEVEAFQSTGNRVFPIEYVNKARQYNEAPLWIGDFKSDGNSDKTALDNIKWHDNAKGNTKVWAMPEYGWINRYLVTVDIGGTTDEADWSVIRVFDRRWISEGGKLEAILTCKLHQDVDIVAWKAAAIAKIYDNALYVIEKNSLNRKKDAGENYLVVLEEIAEHYDNIYKRQGKEDEEAEGAEIKYGFHTNKQTKPMIVKQYNAALRECSYMERDAEALDEADIYEEKSDGSYGNVEGKNNHDDVLVTTMIGVHISTIMDVCKKREIKQQRKKSNPKMAKF